MIARSWKALASEAGARAYTRYFDDMLAPELARIDGHRGAFVLVRRADDLHAIHVLTLWESMQAIARFAGDTPERAVVEPEARAMLASFDDTVTHWDVATRT